MKLSVRAVSCKSGGLLTFAVQHHIREHPGLQTFTKVVPPRCACASRPTQTLYRQLALDERATVLIPPSLKTFLTVMAASASILGTVYVGLVLTLTQAWIEANAALVFTHGLYWLLIPPIFATFIRAQKEATGFHSPAIKKIMDDGLMIVEPCEWLGHRTAVAVFKVQDDVELFVLSAQVINIQSNKLIQLQPITQGSELIDPVNLREIKEKLLIKPGHIT